MTRHLLRDDDLTPAEQAEILDLIETFDSGGAKPVERLTAADLASFRVHGGGRS